MSFPAVRILYGSQWLESVPLARVLCIVAAVEVAYLLAKEVLIANGDVRAGNHLQAAQQGARVVGLLAVVPFGLPGACWGLLVGALAGSYWAHRVLARRIGLTLRDLTSVCWPAVVIALVSCAPAALWATFGTIDEQNFMAVFAAAGCLCTALWLASVRALGHPFWSEIMQLRARLLPRT